MNQQENKEASEKTTVLGIITRKDKNIIKYLLVSSPLDFGQYTGFLYSPGGNIDSGENERDFLVKKLKQELGIEVNPTRKCAETPGDLGNTISWWVCETEVNKIAINQRRVADAKWLSKKEIIGNKNVWPATKKFFETYIED